MRAAVAGQKRLVQHQVHALAGLHQRRRLRLVELAHGIDENAGGIDYGSGWQVVGAARFEVGGAHAGQVAVGVLQQGLHRAVVQGGAAVVEAGLGQVHGQAGIIELPVVVAHAAV